MSNTTQLSTTAPANQTLTRPAATLTRSRPLARPDGPSTGRIPSAASQAPEVSRPTGEGYDEMLTKKELAGKLKVTVRTVENWQREGYLPFIKISSVVLFHWPEVIEHLKSNFKVCRRGVVRPRTGI